MPEQVRRLTQRGVEAFRRYLGEIRSGSRAEPPRELLEDPSASEMLEKDAWVEERSFVDRMDAARYLAGVLDGLKSCEEDIGLWSWLSLYYFDQVCPRRQDGARSPGRDYRHILEPGYLSGHRHLLAGPLMVWKLHQERGQLLLSTRVNEENKFHHEVASRQALLTNPAILSLLNLLYQDPGSGRPKRGAQQTGPNPGSIYRFVDVIHQLDVNYDLYSMTPDGILKLLPSEFERWKPSPRGLFRRRRRA